MPPPKDGKAAADARVEYGVTDKKTKTTETRSADVLLSVGHVRAPGVVADLKTGQRKDGIEYVVGVKAVKAPPADEEMGK